ncbi:MAG: 16S rRNA (guanine(527)-N(7))-methyltransferase RsmG [Chroococcidiopsidaceae cyanobacterium CP_BM_ER_R8_30]|nr:16S rRNA (guanine(527)-N(7))-methyltransferase RsmG [Chroococcidiopsidaceae cyanobacterium CP_BM_ER_R8_30]
MADDHLLPEMIDLWQQTLSWQPTTSQQSQFQQLYELILAGNRQLNLTRIAAPVEFWEKHLWDSLRGVAMLLQEASKTKQQAIDIGTGAGFPGIPVAITLDNWTVTLLDSTRKKMAFLQTLIAQIGILNTTTITDRAEALGQQSQHRQNYDIALVRAVGPASVCAEYALPLLKIGGLAVLYRGHWTSHEAETLPNAVEQLGGVVESTEAFTTPISYSTRHCLYLRKVADTPDVFPRPVGVPAHQPL